MSSTYEVVSFSSTKPLTFGSIPYNSYYCVVCPSNRIDDSKYLMFAVGLVAITTVAVAALEVAVLSQIQQDADAKCRVFGTGYNASQADVILGLYKPTVLKPKTTEDRADEDEEEK
jgi:hypothetical protein